MSRKLFFIFGVVTILVGLSQIIGTKNLKPKNIIYEALVRLHILKPCYNPEANFIEIFSQEGFDYLQKDKEIVENSLRQLLDNNIKDKDVIPTISHHIYFTSEVNPGKLLPFYIDKMEANFNKLNALEKPWQHFIWTNNADLFPDKIKNIKNVIVKDIAVFKGHALYQYLLETIHKGNQSKAYFMEASDILRLMALQKFGGLYNDMDYEIYNAEALFKLIKKFDFIGGREFTNAQSYYSNAVILAKPNHPVINEAIARLEKYNLTNKLADIPNYIKYPCNFYDKLYLNSPPLLTISYFIKSNVDGNNDIILPSWMLLNVDFARYKNGACDYAKINQLGFAAGNDKLHILMDEFSAAVNDNNNIDSSENIYFNLNERRNFPIIGADMFCGTWVSGKAPKQYYWNIYERK